MNYIRRATKALSTLERLVNLPLGRDYLVHGIPGLEARNTTSQWRAQNILESIAETRKLLSQATSRYGSRLVSNGLAGGQSLAAAVVNRHPAGFIAEEVASTLQSVAPWLSGKDLFLMPLTLRIYLLITLSDQASKWILGLRTTDNHIKLLLVLESVSSISSETLSSLLIAVDPILEKDPTRAFTSMDAATKARYRYAIRDDALKSGMSDANCSAQALRRSEEAHRRGETSHVGHHLNFEHSTDPMRVRHPARTLAFALMSVALAAITCSWMTISWEAGCLNSSIALGLIFVIAGSVVETLMLATPFLRNRADAFRMGEAAVTKNWATVVPVMLLNEAQVKTLLEVAMANIGSLRSSSCAAYVLLSDFADSSRQDPSASELRLLKMIERFVGQQNAQGFPCILLHRDREFCREESVWRGWERKRGKLVQFSSLVLKKASCFSTRIGPMHAIENAQWAFVLDEDSYVVGSALGEIVRAAIHPLNLPRLSPHHSSVQEGFGIWSTHAQLTEEDPSASMGKLNLAHGSRDFLYEWLGEGRYTGKGLFHIETFHAVTSNRIPENTVLSHDTIEGAVLRCAAASSTACVERSNLDFYSRCARAHRWTRGDWQNIGWWAAQCLRRGDRKEQFLPLTKAWITALSIQLVRIAFDYGLLLLLLGGIVLRGESGLDVIVVASMLLLLPVVAQCILIFRLHYLFSSLAASVPMVVGILLRRLVSVPLRFSIAPYLALIQLDAVARATVRMWQRRRLLEWSPSSSQATGRWRNLHGVIALLALGWLASAFPFGAIDRAGTLVLGLWVVGYLFARARWFSRLVF